mmetsp:Transcript_27175/g.48781  ORF Transcript_27175/g.48781 Transcript_27175/m.48781 type:complete len:420 (+) Transcript_27175:794-2053(+)
MDSAPKRLLLLEAQLCRKQTLAHRTLEAESDLLELCGFSSIFPEPINRKRAAIRRMLDDKAEAILNAYETDTFPEELKTLIKNLGVFGYDAQLDLLYTPSIIEKAAVGYELSRIDASISTFWVVQQELVITSIQHLASLEQQDKYIPALRRMDLIGSWGLTEPDAGSDASGLELAATPVAGGYRLKGYKKWIGNAEFSDIMVIFARNTETSKVIGLIVESRSPGIKVQHIKHKLAVRALMNGLIEFDDVFVPIENHMPKAQDFESGPVAILGLSRLGIIWTAIGTIAGAYEYTVNYLCKTPLISRDLASIRERLGRMLSLYKSSVLVVNHQTNLLMQGKGSIGQVSYVKAEISKACYEVIKIGCELLQEQGLLLDNILIKFRADMEPMITGEGSYEVGILVAGRELTGIPSIKSSYVMN